MQQRKDAKSCMGTEGITIVIGGISKTVNIFWGFNLRLIFSLYLLSGSVAVLHCNTAQSVRTKCEQETKFEVVVLNPVF